MVSFFSELEKRQSERDREREKKMEKCCAFIYHMYKKRAICFSDELVYQFLCTCNGVCVALRARV